MIPVITRVSRDTKDRIDAAARAADQPLSAWLRMAIMAKLAEPGPEDVPAALRHEAGRG